ncbi:hypothetical protein [Shimia sp.]|uniref:hypothetical protein n=1 Tax=Shimia sp. TaxID=1954381 RepID=UPI003B8CF326
MKNLIWVVVAVAVLAVGYFVFGKSESETLSGSTSPEVAAQSATEDTETGLVEAAVEDVESATEEAVTAVTDTVEAISDEAESAVNDVVDDAGAAVEAATDVVSDTLEQAATTASDATETAVEMASDVVEGATEELTEAAEQATTATSDVTEAATDSVADTAGGLTDVAQYFTVEGFDLSKVEQAIDAAPLGDLQKMSLKTAIQGAVDNPELLTQALGSAKSALGL